MRRIDRFRGSLAPTACSASVLLLLLAGCGDTGASGGTEGPDAALLDGGGDSGVDVDVDSPDLSSPDTDEEDILDAADGSSDVAVEPDTDDGPAEAGEPCTEDLDCESELCIALEAGSDTGVCTELCATDEDCPRDFDCLLLTNDGIDATRICLPVDLCIDADGDEYGLGPGCRGVDCDDEDDASYTGADEVCDGADNDCDERIDENPIDAGAACETGFSGICSEGVLTCADGLLACVQANTPGTETCDTLDNDCDGLTDEGDDGLPLSRTCYDGLETEIGVGACQAGLQTCEAGGFSSCRNQRTPIAETCDEVDNDCDGDTDEGLTLVRYYPDVDGDGFGDADAEAVFSCRRETGFVENRADCDDSEAGAYPGASEVPGDEVDGNCDGFELCYLDGDNDGVRPGLSETVLSADLDCQDSREATAADPIGDCRDDVASIAPGLLEVPGDGIDANCDSLELCFVDFDGDGFRDPVSEAELSPDLTCNEPGFISASGGTGDCDDENLDAYPGAPELCDFVDNDCDDNIDEGSRCRVVGEFCDDNIDCASGFCDAGICADSSGCNVPGSCPSRLVMSSGGGSFSNERFRLDVTIGHPVQGQSASGGGYTLVVGPAAALAGPR